MSFELLTEELTARYHVPTYAAYLARADMGPAYRMHRLVLQVLQRRSGPVRWLLKSPVHLHNLARAAGGVPRRPAGGHPPRPAHRAAVGHQPGRHAAVGPQRPRRLRRDRSLPRAALPRPTSTGWSRPPRTGPSTRPAPTTGATPTSSPTRSARSGAAYAHLGMDLDPEVGAGDGGPPRRRAPRGPTAPTATTSPTWASTRRPSGPASPGTAPTSVWRRNDDRTRRAPVGRPPGRGARRPAAARPPRSPPRPTSSWPAPASWSRRW